MPKFVEHSANNYPTSSPFTINNVAAAATSLDLWKTVLPPFIAALSALLLAFLGFHGANIQQTRRDKADLRKENVKTLAELIGALYLFKASAYRVNRAIGGFHNREAGLVLISTPELSKKNTQERAPLRELRESVIAKAELYGEFPFPNTLGDQNLSSHVRTCVDFLYAIVKEDKYWDANFGSMTDDLVTDLRAIKKYEQAVRLALIERKGLRSIETPTFTWISEHTSNLKNYMATEPRVQLDGGRSEKAIFKLDSVFS